MSKGSVIPKVIELEESCRLSYSISQDFFQDLLSEYALYIQSIDNSYPWERVLEIQDRQQELDNKGHLITDEEFEEYAFLFVMMAALLGEL